MGDETCNLVSHSLGRNDSDLAGDLLVGVEVMGQLRVVLLDDDSGRLLDGLSSDSHFNLAIKTKEIISPQMYYCEQMRIAIPRN